MEKSRDHGQAVIEFILMLAFALLVLTIMQLGFQRIRNFLWMDMACQVIAPCPGCQVDEEILVRARNRAPGSCRRNQP